MDDSEHEHRHDLDDRMVVERRVGWRAVMAMLLYFGGGLILLAGLGLISADLLFHRHFVPAKWQVVAAVAGVTGFILTLLATALRRSAGLRKVQTQRLDEASISYYLAFLVGLIVSADTSWRVFGEKFAITGLERIFAFAGLEIMLLAAGFGMRRTILRGGKPGATRLLIWGLLGISALLSIELAGWPIGPLRVLAGPVLAVLALHFALGAERREREDRTKSRRAAAGLLERIVQELQERLVSRLGLADDSRPAQLRTRERAADRAGRLVVVGPMPKRLTGLHDRRIRRALRQCNAANDPEMRDRVLAAIAINRSVRDLRTIEVPSIWTTGRATGNAPSTIEAEDLEKGLSSTMTTPPTGTSDQTPTIPAHVVEQAPDHPDQTPTAALGAAGFPQFTAWSGGVEQDTSAPVSATPRPQSEPVPHALNRAVVGQSPTVPAGSPSVRPEWSGSGSTAPQLTQSPVSGDANTLGSGVEVVEGEQRLKTRGKSKEAVANLLEPIAKELMEDDDFLSREDVRRLTEVTASTTAGEIQKILKDRYPEHPEPTGRRKPERDRTIARAFNKLTGETPLKSVR